MASTPVPAGGARELDPGGAPFRLAHGKGELVLEAGQYIVGRAPSSDLLLDDPLVSRRHARLLANETTVLIEDLRSENGVFVNEQRIRRSVRLEDGDRVLIGSQELVFHVVPVSSVTDRRSREMPTPESTRLPPVAIGGSKKDGHSTLEADAFEYLGQLADRMLAAGRPSTAERMLSGHIREVLEAARHGEPVDRAVLDAASINAVKLAAALRDAAWVHCVLELHVICGQPTSAPVTRALEKLLSELPNLSRPLVQGYQRALLASLHRLSAQELPLARAVLAIKV